VISFDLSKNQIFIRFVFDCQENLGWGRKKNIIKLGFFLIFFYSLYSSVKIDGRFGSRSATLKVEGL
jgi:hypothetical protein